MSMDKCPIETALDYIRNKWTLEIIRDLFMGKSRFSEFQKSNPKLSSNVLSDRLKDLITKGLMEKIFDEQLKIKYRLTPRGRRLNKVLFELAVFACNCGLEEGKYSESCSLNALISLKKVFKIEND
jgi:DNA-binding HxlR family transcriptional regulator